MYIRLTQPGYETLTGMFGSVHFTNGVSDADLSEQMVNGLKAMVACEPLAASASRPIRDRSPVAPVAAPVADPVDAPVAATDEDPAP